MCAPSFSLEIGLCGLGEGSAGEVLATKPDHLSLLPGGHIEVGGKDLCLLPSATAEVHKKKKVMKGKKKNF